MSLLTNLDDTFAHAEDLNAINKLMSLIDPELLQQAYALSGVATVRRPNLKEHRSFWSRLATLPHLACRVQLPTARTAQKVPGEKVVTAAETVFLQIRTFAGIGWDPLFV